MFSASYYNLQETASQAVLRLPDLVRAAGGDNPPAFGTTARPHVNDIVGVSDDIQVMLDDYDRGTMVNQEASGHRTDEGRSSARRRRIRSHSVHCPSRWQASGAGPHRRIGSGSPRPRSDSRVREPRAATIRADIKPKELLETFHTLLVLDF